MRRLAAFCAAFLLISGICRGQGKDKTVLIVYHSVTGHTEVMSQSVEKGAKSVPGVTVKRVRVEEVKWDDLSAADALILGSPVHNANVATPVQEFINNWPFDPPVLRDKIGAAFVSAAGISAGEEAVQLGILRSMMIFGMVVAGGDSWESAFGASAVLDEASSLAKSEGTEINPHFLKKAEGLGKRVAALVLLMGCKDGE